MYACGMEPGEAITPSDDLRRLLFGYRVSRAPRVVAVLGIADLLADGPRGVEDLAQASGAHASSLYRVLRFLAKYIFHAWDDERSLAILGACRRAMPAVVGCS